MTEERQQRIASTLHNRQENITLILENVFDPHNVMAVLRSADSIGVSEIYLIQTKIPQKNFRFGNRSSSGAVKWVQMHEVDTVAECINLVRKKYKKILATHLSTEAISLHQVDFVTEPIAIAFGNEQYGLSDELLSMVDGNLIIPQVGMIKSLNISVACAVTLYEAFRQKMEAGHYLQKSISATTETEILKFWELEGIFKEEK